MDASVWKRQLAGDRARFRMLWNTLCYKCITLQQSQNIKKNKVKRPKHNRRTSPADHTISLEKKQGHIFSCIKLHEGESLTPSSQTTLTKVVQSLGCPNIHFTDPSETIQNVLAG